MQCAYDAMEPDSYWEEPELSDEEKDLREYNKDCYEEDRYLDSQEEYNPFD